MTENSNALTGRMIVFKLSKSFWNKEDTDLSTKLDKELSGIFNWAMEGLKRRLDRGGYFLQPSTGKELLKLMSDLGNPISTFIEDAIIFDSKSYESKDDIFDCWKHWALKKQMATGTEMAFKRRFMAATQEHGIRADRVMVNKESTHVYYGVKLNEKAKAYVSTIIRTGEGVF